jgi:hypothetical protein
MNVSKADSSQTRISQELKTTYEVLSGHEVIPYLDRLGELRIAVFSEYPYLYDGSIEAEKNYLKMYAQSKSSLVVLSKIDKKIIGFIAGLPFTESLDNDYKDSFLTEVPIEKTVFYLGEILIQIPYRRNKIGNQLFQLFEHQLKLKGYKKILGCTVIREANSDKQEEGFSIEQLIISKGAAKCADLIQRIGWKEVGKDESTEHFMQYWEKELDS